MTCRPCRKQRRQSVCKSRTEPGDAHIPVKTRILKGQQKMKVESEDSKTSTNTEELSGTGTKNPSTNPKDDEELDEGEIVDDNEPSTKPTAVIHEPHPLEHSWTFWFHNPSGKSKQATWDSSRRSIYTFSTVEQFWSLYNNIDRPSKLAVGADSYFFKHEIKPNWEDPVCANGGKWTLIFSRRKSDQCWLYTLLALIGEQFDHGDEICGVVVNVRVRQEKIALWTKNAANEAAQLSIGKQWKELLDYHDTIGFIFHEDAKHSRSAKKRYTA